MPIGKILVPLMGLPVDRPALELAFRAGQHLDAHVAGMYAAYDALSVVAEAAEPPNDAMSVESRTRAREARANFDAAKAKSGAAPRNRPAQGVGFSSAFVLANGRLDDMVAEHGRTADVTVLTLPAGQVTVRASQSMVKQLTSKPSAAAACQLVSRRTGPTSSIWCVVALVTRCSALT